LRASINKLVKTVLLFVSIALSLINLLFFAYNIKEVYLSIQLAALWAAIALIILES